MQRDSGGDKFAFKETFAGGRGFFPGLLCRMGIANYTGDRLFPSLI